MKKGLLLMVVIALADLPAFAQKDENNRIANAGKVLVEILNVSDDIPADLLDRAECVIVLPSVVKAEEAQLAGLVGSDADNLKDAIEGESYEVDAMYPEFADKAKVTGDTAARFEEVRHDEIGRRDAFRTALAKLKS
jgi:rubrerythrin